MVRYGKVKYVMILCGMVWFCTLRWYVLYGKVSGPISCMFGWRLDYLHIRGHAGYTAIHTTPSTLLPPAQDLFSKYLFLCFTNSCQLGVEQVWRESRPTATCHLSPGLSFRYSTPGAGGATAAILAAEAAVATVATVATAAILTQVALLTHHV